jgi:hypothetical protein
MVAVRGSVRVLKKRDLGWAGAVRTSSSGKLVNGCFGLQGGSGCTVLGGLRTSSSKALHRAQGALCPAAWLKTSSQLFVPLLPCDVVLISSNICARLSLSSDVCHSEVFAQFGLGSCCG